MLPTRELVTAFDALCLRSRKQNRHIIAAFRVTRSKDLAGSCLTQNPFE